MREEAPAGRARIWERLGWESGLGETMDRGSGGGVGWLRIRVWGEVARESGLQKGMSWGQGMWNSFVSPILLI